MTTVHDPRLSLATGLASRNADLSSLWLYGSRARGDQGTGSDYDFAVTFAHRAASPLAAVTRLGELRSALAEALDAEVSVVELDRVATPLAASIVSEGRLLLDRAPVETGWLCQRIWSKWDDWCFRRDARPAQ